LKFNHHGGTFRGVIRRHLTSALLASLADSPVVLLNGARQTGKTTLARWVATDARPARYLTLDDPATLAAARSDPGAFVEGLGGPVVLDEVQRAPEVFPAIKVAVDRRRQPGRFLLTGSANVMLLPRLSESLAGRMQILTLWPLSQGEIEGVVEGFVDAVYARTLPTMDESRGGREDALARALRGGYPDVFRRPSARRDAWYEGYVATILQRDVRDLANIEGLSALPRLLSLLAARTSTLLHVAEVSRSAGIPATTLGRYLTLFEATYLLREISAWSANLSKRLVRSARFLLSDSGLAAHLLGFAAARLEGDAPESGRLLETFVAMELEKQAAWSRVRPSLFHFRTHTGREVDVVLEDKGGNVVGIEVKASTSVGPGDFRGLRTLQEAAGARFRRGVVLYTGSESLAFGPDLHALPVAALWRLAARPHER
jgi:predicted AAA+ superfamily ATPase